ncbi:MAG: hypothetical protein V9G20_24670 [Candidatus Promineifilaceae bacterium]
MAGKKALPDDIREQIITKINAFNHAHALPIPPTSASPSRIQKLLGHPSTTIFLSLPHPV